MFEVHFLVGNGENNEVRIGGGSWPLEYDNPLPKMVNLLAGTTFSLIPGDSQPQLRVRVGRGILLPPKKAEVGSLPHWIL